MYDLKLDNDEGIFYQSEDVVYRSSRASRDQDINEMILTNKNLYLIYTKGGGLFSSPTTEVIVRPLSDIKVINGRPMVDEIKDRSLGYGIRVQFLDGIDSYYFGISAFDSSEMWHRALYRAITGEEMPVEQPVKERKSSGFFSSVKSLAGSTAEIVSIKAKQAAEVAGVQAETIRAQAASSKPSYIPTMVEPTPTPTPTPTSVPASTPVPPSIPASEPVSTSITCLQCGTVNPSGAKFCSNCGNNLKQQVAPQETRVSFQGSVRKCPSCGAGVSGFMAFCPECGHELNQAQTASAIADFTNKLAELDRAIVSVGGQDGLTDIVSSSFDAAKKVGWVALNLYTLGIPQIVKSTHNRGKDKSTEKYVHDPLYIALRNKADFIENYVFPNDRETLLEALVLVRSKMATFIRDGHNDINDMMEDAWMAQAIKLRQKARMLLSDDGIAVQLCNEIVQIDQKYKSLR